MKIPKKVKEKWQEMTEWNHHTEVLIEIAKFFKLEEYQQCFENILQAQYWYGSLQYGDYLLRYSAEKNMLKEIGEKFGEETKKEVYSCT